MKDAEHRADNTLRGKGRRGLLACSGLCASLIDDESQNVKRLRATLQDLGTTTKRLDNQKRPQRRLLGDEQQQGAKTRPHTLPPTRPLRDRCPRDQGRSCQSVVKQREEAVFAVLELLIKGTPGNTRPSTHPRHAHPAITKLGDDTRRRGEQPRTLNLGYPTTRRKTPSVVRTGKTQSVIRLNRTPSYVRMARFAGLLARPEISGPLG